MIKPPFTLLAVAALFCISACGFSPVYGDYSNSSTETEVSAALSRVSINPLKDREGQYLRNALIDRFYKNGYPDNPLYHLNIGQLDEQETDFDITVDSEATRRQLKISSQITLINLVTQETILSQKLYSLSSYNILGSEFATRSSEENTRDAILDDLARQIEQRISLTLNK